MRAKWIILKPREQKNDNELGRFPANLIHDNSEEVRECFPESKSVKGKPRQVKNIGSFGGGTTNSDNEYNDSGNASRFFKSIIYQAKASKSERNKGCEDIGGNKHCTVKPTSLMKYLITMITPKRWNSFRPFTSSGSTLCSHKESDFQYIGIELTENTYP